MREEYEQRHERVAEALRAGARWIYIIGEHPSQDCVHAIRDNQTLYAPARYVGPLLGWNAPLHPRKDDFIGLLGTDPIMTMPRGSRVEIGNPIRLHNVLVKDIFMALRDGGEWTVSPTYGFVKIVFDDGITGARTYRNTGEGVLVFDIAGDGAIPVGSEIFYILSEKPKLEELFAEAAKRLAQSLKDREELEEVE